MSVQGHTQDLQKWDSTLVILKFYMNYLSYIFSIQMFTYHIKGEGGGGGGGGVGEKGGCVSVRATGNTPEYGPIYISFSLVNVKNNNLN